MRTAAARARVEKRDRPETSTDRQLRTLKRAIYNNGFSSTASVTELANTTRSQAAGGTKKVTVSSLLSVGPSEPWGSSPGLPHKKPS